MIWFLIVPVVFVIAVRELLNESNDNSLDLLMAIMAGGLFAFLAAIPAVAAALAIGLLFQSSPVKVGEDILVAIRTKDSVEGRFFLGSGFVQGDQYYFWYRKLPDGNGLEPGRTYAGSGVRVYEEDRQDALMVSWQWQLDQPWAWLVSIPTSAGGKATDFHVPTGTVLQGYSM